MMAISMITATMTIRSTGMISVPSIGKPITATAACSKRGSLHCEPGLAGVQRVAPDIMTTDREHCPECHNRDVIPCVSSPSSSDEERMKRREFIAGAAALRRCSGKKNLDHLHCLRPPRQHRVVAREPLAPLYGFRAQVWVWPGAGHHQLACCSDVSSISNGFMMVGILHHRPRAMALLNSRKGRFQRLYRTLSRIVQLDQRTALPDQCLHSGELGPQGGSPGLTSAAVYSSAWCSTLTEGFGDRG